MEKKKLFLPIILALIIIFSIGPNVSQAATQYVIGLKAVRSYPGHEETATSDLQADSTAYAYMINGKVIWKLLEYQGATVNADNSVVEGTGTANWNNTIYCLKAGLGFTSPSGGLSAAQEENIRVLYPYSEAMAALDTRISISGRTEYKSIIKMGWEAQKNNSVLWILDNAYMKNLDETAKTEIKKYLFSSMLNYINDTNNTGETIEMIRENLENFGISSVDDIILTDSDIDVIQQAAIWYYTNDGESAYNYSGVPTLQISESTTTDSTLYNSIEDTIDPTNFYGEGYLRSVQAQALFYYLTRAAEKESTNYSTTRALTPTVKFENQTAQIETSEGQTIVGPFKYTVTKNGKNVYGYEIDVEAQKIGESSYSQISEYKLVKSNKITETTIEEIEGQDFYVVIEDSDISKVKVTTGATYIDTEATIWTAEDPNSEEAQTEQPVVIINKTEKPVSAVKEVTTDLKFDLALRKYITKVNDQTVETREPEIDKNTIDSEGTATYKHRKDPVTVETGNTVTYKITIYNEGEMQGYATKVVDQLATGLKFVRVVSGNFEAETSTYNETGANTLTLVRKATATTPLNAYTSGNLDSETIEIECEVTAEVGDTNKVLTNVAWIAEEKNTETNTTIINDEGLDRDSEPGTTPNVDKDSMSNYKGNNSNKGVTPADSDYYYKGEQDDDDFEKVILPGQSIDLALRKYITKVNETDVTNTREPNIDRSTINGTDTTTATYKHRKDPVVIKTGDIITYNITVYNEGTIEGRATEIVDQLPTGLESNLATGERVTSTKGNEYTVTYDSETNKLTLTTTGTTNIAGYNGTTLDSDTIEITCTVTAEAGTSNKVLTNVAWINADSSTTLTDRDSEPATTPNVNKDNMSNYTGNENKSDLTDSDYYYKGQQDDDDFEKIILPKIDFDLALRKYITKVNETDVTNTREPNIDRSTINGTDTTTATYKHRKDPVVIKTGDIITYNITVYNEGTIEGRATEIVDQLPTGLKFVRLVSGDYTAEEISNNKIKFTAKNNLENLRVYDGTTLDSETIEIECLVTAKQSNSSKVLTNVAWISEDTNPLDVTDRDSSTENNPEGKNQPDYNGNTSNKEDLDDDDYYYKGEQDDDDFEKIILEPGFDLSLRKFIVSVNGEELTGENSRVPQVDVTGLKNGTSKTAKYTHPKTPVTVQKGDVVIYTIRVYNEGNADGYAEEITDYLPEGLGYLVGHKINAENGWVPEENAGRQMNVKDIPETTNYLELEDFDEDYLELANISEVGDAYIISGELKLTSSKLRYRQYEETNIIKAYDGGDTLNYKDIQIACVVVSDDLRTDNLRNIAEISKAKDKVGNDMNNNGDDRDSIPDNVDPDNYNPPEDNSTYQEDDDDYEDLILKHFDLALRKFITKVNGIEETVSRAPIARPDREKLIRYEHTKEPVKVKHNDLVTYTLRIFNEGSIAGYAEEIKDHIPEGLQFVANNETNLEYGWKMYKLVNGEEVETDDETEATIITTDYLSRNNGADENLIEAFDEVEHISANGNYYLPDYRDVEVVLKVIEPNTSDRVLTNIAQISEDADKDGNPVNDVDSTPNNYPDEDRQRSEDDIDHDNVILEYFDLALRKFITEIRTNDVIEKVDSRIPQVSYENEKITYTHPKDPILVTNGSIVTYTIRIFNEGKIDGYAEEITDDIPEGLVFLPDNATNKEYRWVMIDEDGNETDDVSKAVKITTDYLSKEQETEDGDNLIKAFDKNENISELNPDYRDVKVAFRVTEEKLPQDRILINTAEISEDADKDGNPIDDEDSIPDNNKPDEDDIDTEAVRVKYFDLSLLKYVSKVIVTEDGKTKVTETGYNGLENPEPMPKVEIKQNKLNTTEVQFAYTIKITNEGEIEGYATEITDDIPAGLKFVAKNNPAWTEENGKIKTRALENTLLQPGESATVEVVFTWINDKNNLGEKTNTAEISEDKNEYGSPDIDSTPGNEKPGEDDIDIAKVILSIKTGKENIVPILIGGTIILAILAGGVVLIKRYVI